MKLDLVRNWLGVELGEVSPKEVAISGLGGLVSILLTMLVCLWVLSGPAATCIIASMGASAVLLFAVPHGQLSQPWPVIAGHGFSALLGVMCARWVHPPELAAAGAVALSILAMHLLKCIHPPGGATALTAVLGSAEVHRLGFGYVLFPVLLNALVMVSIAVLFNACFPWRRYPAFLNHRPEAADSASGPAVPSHGEIVKALRELDSFVDITEEDLVRLVQALAPRPIKPARGLEPTGDGRNDPTG